MTKGIDEFNQYRTEMNERILSSDNLGIKRFFALDHQAYEAGALDSKTKELLGLVASLVLRCDDCITYHVIQCVEQGVTSRRIPGYLQRSVSRRWLDNDPAFAPRV